MSNLRIVIIIAVVIIPAIYRWVLGDKDKEPEKVRWRLMFLIWAVIGADVIGTLFLRDIGLNNGVLDFVDIGLKVWLAVAIGNNKNWARVTWIASSFLDGLIIVILLMNNAKNMSQADFLACFLPILCLGGSIIVACILLNRAVKKQFVKDAKGVAYACAYWIASFIILVLIGVKQEAIEVMEKEQARQATEYERQQYQQGYYW